MSEISKEIKALLKFMEGVSSIISEIKNEEDLQKIKKPSTLEECHELIDGFFYFSIINAKVNNGLAGNMLESLNAHMGKLND